MRARELPIDTLSAERCVGGCDCAPAETLRVEYFGASGFRLVRGRDEILLGPFFSNVSLPRAGPLGLSIEPQIETIHRYLPDVSRSQAILVGHAHYDHLLDVPHIARHHARKARIYLSETGASILAADRALDGRVEAVDRSGWVDGEEIEGHWIDVPGTRVRFLPIRSQHAPHFLGLTFMTGHIHRPRQTFPRTSGGWMEGQTFAYLIEFQSEDPEKPDYRVYYQDSSTNGRVGLPPEGVKVDLALVCVASYGEVKGHPETLVSGARPKHLLLSHWENFFRPYTQDPHELRTVPATDVPGFLDRLRAAGVPDGDFTLALPGRRYRMGRCP